MRLWATGSVYAGKRDSEKVKHTASALKVIRHRHGKVELLDLILRDAVGSGHIVGDGQVLADETRVGGLVQVADIRAGAVGVDLVNRHRDLAACPHLGHGTVGERCLGVFGHVDVAGELRAAAVVDQVRLDLRIADDGRIELARVDGGAVAGDFGID